MITQNLHMHSTWDDGRCSCEEMIRASMDAGLSSVGVSVHCPEPEENGWSAKLSDIPAYLEEMAALKEKYADQIAVYTGIEWDPIAQIDLSPYDYVIGSVHHLPIPGAPTVDESAEVTAQILSASFGGDRDALAMMYFAEYRKVADNPLSQIVGHFDLLTKFDETHRFFDENSPRYARAAENAMERLVMAGKIFEVNTGAISRGYRTAPYPSKKWLNLLREMGGRVCVSSDAHHISGVNCAFDAAEQLLKDAGFTETWILEGKKFVPVKL